ncbi:hypothetical protein CsSME_00020074 [Camellia sinensis var. sinensis]
MSPKVAYQSPTRVGHRHASDTQSYTSGHFIDTSGTFQNSLRERGDRRERSPFVQATCLRQDPLGTIQSPNYNTWMREREKKTKLPLR